MLFSVESVEKEIFDHLMFLQKPMSPIPDSADGLVAGAKRPLEEVDSAFTLTEVILTAFALLEFLLDSDLMGFLFSHVLEGGTLAFFCKIICT